MNRRTFIKSAFATVVSLSIPNIDTAIGGVLQGNFYLDFDGKTIHYIGNGPTITVSELYRWLQDQWDKPDFLTEPNISIRHSDEVVELIRGWTVSKNAVEHLTGGCLKENGNMWISVYGRSNQGQG